MLNLIFLILSTFLTINIFWFNNIWVGLFLGFLFLLFYGFRFGDLFFTTEPHLRGDKFWKLFFGLLFLCALIIIFSTPIYYLYKLDNFIISSFIIIISLFFLFYKKKNDIQKQSWLRGHDIKITSFNLFLTLPIILIILEGILFYFLFKAQTIEAIRAPWQIINYKFFVLYFISSFILVFLFFRKKGNTAIKLILLCIHSFLTLSLGLIVYKIGYGFDPFIHRATENLIYELGQVSPKPFYYIGQYTLVVFLSKILMAPLVWIDKLILPISAAIFLPPTIYWSFKKLFYLEARPLSNVTVLFLTVPLTIFIATTPQGLANFFILFLIFLSVGFRKYWILILLALAALMIHPLAGIPALIFIGLCRLEKIKNFKLRNPLFILFFLIAIIIIPLVFIIKDAIFCDALILKLPEWSVVNENLHSLLPSFENRYGMFYDFVYFYKNNLAFIIIILAGIGAWVARKHGSLPYFLCAIIIAINAILLKLFINFPDVIEYEQMDYANRLFQIAGYFLLPLCLFALALFFKRLMKAGLVVRIFFILIFASLMTFSIYLTYPRVDRYALSHNINTSLADINAAHFIEDNSGGEDYIVLANQAVSAAALQEFGFKKYYSTDDGEIFYYPIPTGGKLYQYYLGMVYIEPTRETMLKAMNLVGVKQGYFVLNKYWTNSERILEKAKMTADEWWGVDNDAIFVLKYIVEEEEE